MADTGRWQLLQDLFQKALELPEQERARWLEQACGDDGTLREEVESLVLARGQTEKLGQIVDRAARRLVDRIGPYKVERELGRGGMGVVYLATRDDDAYEKRVAIKVVRAGFDTEEGLHRFRSERQILASLDHPNIARMLDGGATEDGLPYVVMEYVEGRSLPKYCADRGLDTNERLRLFQKVCAAVEYAHQNLVVHRDLKPGNILVTEEGEPKLLDFGIAKLLTPTVEQTLTLMRALTPEYASPEQMSGEAVGTTSDIYSLGVVLCELLTGKRPDQTGSIVVPEELQGDVENILSMAMRKEAERRYASVGQFAEDIGRYLDGYPVRARRDTWSYRTGKFVRRNRYAVAAGIAVAVVLTGAVAQVVQARSRAEAEALRAREVSDFLVKSFEAADPWQSGGEKVTAKQILESSEKRIAEELAGQPVVRANLLESIGRAYLGLGMFEQSRAALESALDLRKKSLGANDPLVAKTVGALAETVDQVGDHRKVLALYEEALRTAGDRWTPGDPDRLDVEERLGLIHLRLGDYPKAEKILLDVTARRKQFHGEEHRLYSGCLLSTGLVYEQKGDFRQAETYYRKAYDLRRKAYPEEHPEVARAMNNLASALWSLGRVPEAEAMHRRALEIQRKTMGADHPDVAISLNNLGHLLSNQGKKDEALKMFHEVVEMHKRIGREEHAWVAMTMNNIGVALRDKGDWKGAADAYRKALALNEKLYGKEHPEIANVTSNLAVALTDGKLWDEAEGLQRKALAMKRKLVPDGPGLPFSLHSLGVILLELARPGEVGEAEALVREAIETGRKTLGPEHWRIAQYSATLGAALTRQRKFDEAEPLLREAVAKLEKARGGEAKVTVDARKELARAQEATRSSIRPPHSLPRAGR